MARSVEQFGGVVDAFMGDGVAAFFGVPVAHEDDPERAARAALHIVHVVGEYARDIEAAWGISDFNVRVGLNSGPVAVGLVGGAKRQSVALGDTPNVAARLQSAAEPGSVVGGRGDGAPARGPVRVRIARRRLGQGTRGAACRSSVSSVLCTVSIASRRLRSSAATRSWSGWLMHGTTCSRGAARCCSSLGDAGIGKTRLLAELRGLAGDSVYVARGRLRLLRRRVPPAARGRRRCALARAGGGRGDPCGPHAPADQAGAAARRPARRHACRISNRCSSGTGDEPAARCSRATPRKCAGPAASGSRRSQGRCPSRSSSRTSSGPIPWTCDLAHDLLQVVERAPLLLAASFRIAPQSDGWRFRVSVLAEHPHRSVELALAPLAKAEAVELLSALSPERASASRTGTRSSPAPRATPSISSSCSRPSSSGAGSSSNGSGR